MRHFPRRIVSLTKETVETLYLLGEQDRIAGVSGYAVRPPQVRREKGGCDLEFLVWRVRRTEGFGRQSGPEVRFQPSDRDRRGAVMG